MVGLVEAREEAKVRPSVEWEARELTSLLSDVASTSEVPSIWELRLAGER